MSENTKKKSWPEIGQILESKEGKRYVKFKDNVTILVDGVEVEMNASRSANLQTPQAQIDGLLKSGAINEEQAEQRKAKVPAFVKHSIIVPPPKEN